MSIHTYNDITFISPLHTSFTQECLYDPSDTDREFVKLDVTVQCLITPDVATGVGIPESSQGSAAAMAKYMREKLTVPRKAWSIKSSDVELIPSHGATVDAKNGPHPQSFNFTMMTEQTFIATWRCIGHFSSVDTPEAANYFTSVRWSDEVSIDDLNYSTRTRRGRYRIRSDNKLTQEVDRIRRAVAILGVPRGFLRKSSRYTLSEDGLQIDFEIQDQEVFRVPPAPAFRSRGTYTETTTKNGAMRHGAIRLDLWGDKLVSPSILLKKCIEVAAAKLLLVGGAQQRERRFARLEQCDFGINLYENHCWCNMRCLLNSRHEQANDPRLRVNGVATIDFDAITRAPLYSAPQNVTPPKYLDLGTAALFLQAARYFDPGATITLNSATGDTTVAPLGIIPGTGRDK